MVRLSVRALLATGLFGGGSSSPTDSLTANAYPDYTTLWVNHETGSSGNSGMSELSPKATINQALALVSSGGTRIIVRGDTALSDHVGPPAAGGTSDDARVVTMGHPDFDMPAITLGGFNFRMSSTAARHFLTLRKMRLTGSDSSTTGTRGCIEVGLNNDQEDFVAEFIQADTIRYTGTPDNSACIYLRDDSAPRAIIRQCKLGDVQLASGGHYNNGCSILSYQNDSVLIDRCELYNAHQGARWKEPPSGNIGPTITRSIFRQITDRGVMLQNDNNVAGSHNGARIAYCLFYGIDVIGVQFYDPTNGVNDVTVEHCTFAEDSGGQSSLQFRPASGIKVRRNVFLSSDEFFSTRSSLCGFEICNHNLYLVAGGQLWQIGLDTGNTDIYTSFAAWQSAKTNDNHPDFGELITANPDPDSQTIANLSDFSGIASRDYTYGGSMVCDDGLPPGYDPADCGAGW